MNSVVAFPTPLTETSDVSLPVAYQAARTALAECERIDECKTWSDKAAAMASYARQAKDDSLRVMAVRIQARAERRCGELLKQIPRADEATRYGQVAAVPPVTRSKAATDAGLSERQRKTALRIASVPAAAFEAQVESPRPPSITQLANQGKSTRYVVHSDQAPTEDFDYSVESQDPPDVGDEGTHGQPPVTGIGDETLEADPVTAMATADFLRRFAELCETTDPIRIAHALPPGNAKQVRQQVCGISRWLDRLIVSIENRA